MVSTAPQTVIEKAEGRSMPMKAPPHPGLSVRLDKAFGGTAEAWLALQTAFDLAEARKRARGMSSQRFKEPRASHQSTGG